MKPLANADAAAMAAAEPVQVQADFDRLPPLFAMDCFGLCMAPLIADGSKLVFSRAERVEAGDVAAIWWAPGKNAPGSFQVQIKQVLTPRAPDGRFVYRLFRPYTVLAGRRDDTLGLVKCIGFKRPDGTMREVDFAAMIARVQSVRPA